MVDSESSSSKWKTITATVGAVAALVTAAAALISALDKSPAEQRLATQWLGVLADRNLDAMVSLSALPFYSDGHILVSSTDTRRELADLFDDWLDEEGRPPFVVQRLDARTVGEFKASGLIRAHLHDSLPFGDSEFAVAVYSGDEVALLMFFRRARDTLEFAGFEG